MSKLCGVKVLNRSIVNLGGGVDVFSLYVHFAIYDTYLV